MQSGISINLVKNKTTTIDEVVRWALTIGRLLVIIVEIVAFSTFLYRFSLDRTLIDLQDEITQQQALVESLSERESIYRNLQDRIKLASEINESGGKKLEILNKISSLTPSDVNFNSISIAEKEIKIDADTSSLVQLGEFVKSVRKYDQVSSAGIDSINNSQSGLTNVLITIVLK